MKESFVSLQTPPPRSNDKNLEPSTVAFPLESIASKNAAGARPFSTSKIHSAKKTIAQWTKRQPQHTKPEMKLPSDEADLRTFTLPASSGFAFKHLLIWISSLLFFLAALVGLYTNLSPVATMQLYSYHDFATFGSQQANHQPTHHRVLFRDFHEPLARPLPKQDRRPQLVIHMGPHKTASTTLQTDLTYYQDRLLQDNYVYSGRFYYPYTKDDRLVLNRPPDSAIQAAFRDMYKRCWKHSKKECVEEVRDLLSKTFRKPFQQTLNLLISDEVFLKLFEEGSNQTENYVLLKEILGRDWDILLILAYRRFYEWLPSYKHQKDKPTVERSKVEWPGNTTAGVAFQPLFPPPGADEAESRTQAMLADWGSEHFFSESTIETLRNLTDASFQLKIYHMYGKLSLRTTFLCRVLPDAPSACRASQQEDALQQETRINTRASNDAVYVPDAFFDAMATDAAAKGWIDTKQWQRQTVARKLREYYHASSLPNLGDPASVDNGYGAAESLPPNTASIHPPQLPLICPSESQLEMVLRHSLCMEAKYLPKLYAKTSAEHRAGFWAAVSSTVDYCSIDTDRVSRRFIAAALSSSSPLSET